jgi:diguanylate cyclase (GGDEF)-like protein/PAS domain S-box-containing protein
MSKRGGEARPWGGVSHLITSIVQFGIRRPIAVVTATITGLALVAGLTLAVQAGDQSAREADARQDRYADTDATVLATLFSNASRDLRLARLNAVYRSALTHDPLQLDAQQRQLVEQGIAYVGERYEVDEICLIRRGGAETARWVQGQLATVDSLAPDESGNPFFKPASNLADDQVYVTQPYISPDSARWVYGFATPIVQVGGEHSGVLHFEIPIQRLVDALGEHPFSATSYTALIDRSGHLLSHPDLTIFRVQGGLGQDPAHDPFPVAASSGPADWRAVVSTALASGTPGTATFGSSAGTARVAYRSVPGTDLITLSVTPTSELYSDVNRARLNVLETAGPLVLLMVVLTIWFSRRLVGTNRQLAAANQASSQLAAIVRSADDAILSVEPDGRIATWNEGAAEMYRLPAADAIGRPLAALFPADRQAQLPHLLATALGGEPVERLETVHQRSDGSVVDVWLTLSPIRGLTGEVSGASVVTRDITDRKLLEEQLAHQALHDALTGLPNRVLFQDRLSQSLRKPRRPERARTGRHAVLFIDLDDFKVINDTLGHRVGDELLVAVASRIRDSLRAGDTAARLGGDEFTVLIENVAGPEDAERAADRILEQIRRPYELDGHQIVISASIGIAMGVPETDAPDDVLRCADTALYEAKGLGKGRHETFQPTMNVRAWRRLEIEGQLRRAIAANQLTVHYQPIVDLTTGAIVEVEALVRWQHPDQGLIPPAEFISLAEQTGLIVQVDEFVREVACAQLVAWDREFEIARHLAVSVNISPRELAHTGFASGIAALLERVGLAPSRLKLEITENATLEGEAALQTLRQLRAMGVRVAIDDFGTGYSSLGYFRDLPIDGLKIDRAFINGLGREREDTAIVTAAVAFAQALDLEVTGEGIESAEQLDRLRELGCQLGQGYLFSKPAEAAELTRRLAALNGIAPTEPIEADEPGEGAA